MGWGAIVAQGAHETAAVSVAGLNLKPLLERQAEVMEKAPVKPRRK